MKKQNIIIGLFAVSLAGLFIISKTPAQGNPREQVQHQAVMVGSGPAYHRDEQGTYIPDGLYVAWVDASPGAFAVERQIPLAAAIAAYMNLGFSHETLSPQGYHLFKK